MKLIYDKVFLLLFLSLHSETTKAAYQPYKETDPDYGASVYHLKLLVLEELNLLPLLLEEAKANVNQRELKNYVEDFTTSNMGQLDESGIHLEQFAYLLKRNYINLDAFAQDVVKHPLKSSRTIRRYLRFLSRIPEITSQEELQKSFHSLKSRIKFPKTSDLEASMLNILRLRKIFRLSLSDLIDGQLQDLRTKSGLTLEQLEEIGDFAGSLRMYSHAIDIYDELIKSCEESQSHSHYQSQCIGISVQDTRRKLVEVVEEHDELLKETEFDRSDLSIIPPDSSPFLFTEPLGNMTSDNFRKRQYLDFEVENLPVFLIDEGLTVRDINFGASPVVYEKLCRGESFQVLRNENGDKRKKASSLNCFYSQGPQSTFLLDPLKVEVHHENPPVIQIYDVLHESEVKMFQDEVRGEMRQSRTAGSAADDLGETSRFRTSANAWIEDDLDERFKFFNRRIAQITGLNATGYFSSEITQVAAYNAGGHYTPHSDAILEELIVANPNFPETEMQRGDRIMTFMVYLSDVEKGGCTGFSVLKTLICPVKGSAVLWHNLKSDGSINYDMIHGGCPVLYGTKWIANKWIRSNDQMFIRKCTRDRTPWKLI